MKTLKEQILCGAVIGLLTGFVTFLVTMAILNAYGYAIDVESNLSYLLFYGNMIIFTLIGGLLNGFIYMYLFIKRSGR